MSLQAPNQLQAVKLGRARVECSAECVLGRQLWHRRSANSGTFQVHGLLKNGRELPNVRVVEITCDHKDGARAPSPKPSFHLILLFGRFPLG